jgi:DNA-binding NtrC family response regulator
MELYEKLRKMQILLIDDDEWIRDAMQLFFESEGCSIKTFETAEEGLSELEKNYYDIIISDYRLPGTDGLKFLKMTSVIYPRALKILITAYGNEQVISEAKRIGIQDLIEKPFTTRTLETSLSKLVED